MDPSADDVSDDELGLYDDLLISDDNARVLLDRQRNERFECFEKENAELKAKVEELQKLADTTQKQNAVLKRNISILYQTAKLEISRKDQAIHELQSRYDSMVFRRNQRWHDVKIEHVPSVTSPAVLNSNPQAADASSTGAPYAETHVEPDKKCPVVNTVEVKENTHVNCESSALAKEISADTSKPPACRNVTSPLNAPPDQVSTWRERTPLDISPRRSKSSWRDRIPREKLPRTPPPSNPTVTKTSPRKDSLTKSPSSRKVSSKTSPRKSTASFSKSPSHRNKPHTSSRHLSNSSVSGSRQPKIDSRKRLGNITERDAASSAKRQRHSPNRSSPSIQRPSRECSLPRHTDENSSIRSRSPRYRSTSTGRLKNSKGGGINRRVMEDGASANEFRHSERSSTGHSHNRRSSELNSKMEAEDPNELHVRNVPGSSREISGIKSSSSRRSHSKERPVIVQSGNSRRSRQKERRDTTRHGSSSALDQRQARNHSGDRLKNDGDQSSMLTEKKFHDKCFLPVFDKQVTDNSPLLKSNEDMHMRTKPNSQTSSELNSPGDRFRRFVAGMIDSNVHSPSSPPCSLMQTSSDAVPVGRHSDRERQCEEMTERDCGREASRTREEFPLKVKVPAENGQNASLAIEREMVHSPDCCKPLSGQRTPPDTAAEVHDSDRGRRRNESSSERERSLLNSSASNSECHIFENMAIGGGQISRPCTPPNTARHADGDGKGNELNKFVNTPSEKHCDSRLVIDFGSEREAPHSPDSYNMWTPPNPVRAEHPSDRDGKRSDRGTRKVCSLDDTLSPDENIVDRRLVIDTGLDRETPLTPDFLPQPSRPQTPSSAVRFRLLCGQDRTRHESGVHDCDEDLSRSQEKTVMDRSSSGEYYHYGPFRLSSAPLTPDCLPRDNRPSDSYVGRYPSFRRDISQSFPLPTEPMSNRSPPSATFSRVCYRKEPPLNVTNGSQHCGSSFSHDQNHRYDVSAFMSTQDVTLPTAAKESKSTDSSNRDRSCDDSNKPPNKNSSKNRPRSRGTTAPISSDNRPQEDGRRSTLVSSERSTKYSAKHEGNREKGKKSASLRHRGSRGRSKIDPCEVSCAEKVTPKHASSAKKPEQLVHEAASQNDEAGSKRHKRDKSVATLHQRSNRTGTQSESTSSSRLVVKEGDQIGTGLGVVKTTQPSSSLINTKKEAHSDIESPSSEFNDSRTKKMTSRAVSASSYSAASEAKRLKSGSKSHTPGSQRSQVVDSGNRDSRISVNNLKKIGISNGTSYVTNTKKNCGTSDPTAKSLVVPSKENTNASRNEKMAPKRITSQTNVIPIQNVTKTMTCQSKRVKEKLKTSRKVLDDLACKEKKVNKTRGAHDFKPVPVYDNNIEFEEGELSDSS